jgi:hypothetical protein
MTAETSLLTSLAHPESLFMINEWSWTWYIGFIDYLSEWQDRFERERTVLGEGTDSLREHNGIGHIFTRGINSESAEALEFIEQGNWNEAKLELVDQVIFLSSLFNQLNMQPHDLEDFAEKYWSRLNDRNGNGRVDRLNQGRDILYDHNTSYVSQFDGVNPTVFRKGEFDVDSVLEIQSLIQQESIQGLRKHLQGKTDEVKMHAVAIMIHLGFLFQIMDMNPQEVSDLAFGKMDHNEQKYALEFFGQGKPLEEAIRYAKITYNNGQ